MAVLVKRKAPDFTAPAVLANSQMVGAFNFHQEIEGSYALLYFYPLDFTFVCPTELLELNEHMAAFEERGVKVIAVSIDSHFTHNAWRNTPIHNGGIGPVNFPMVSDKTHSICQAYGVEHPSEGIAFRGAFIIDKEGTVRVQIVNDLPIGRSTEELLRLIDAVQFADQHGEVCPAGWQKGKKAMKATSEGVAAYLIDRFTSK